MLKSRIDSQVTFRPISLLLMHFVTLVANGNPPHLGAIVSLTGTLAPYGFTAKRGIEMAIDSLKKKGQMFTLTIEDDGSQPQQAGFAMNRLQTLGVPLVVGSLTSASTLVALTKARELSIPIISPGATSNHINSTTYPNAFPLCFNNETQGKLLGDFVYKELKSKKITLFVDQGSDYGNEILESLKKRLEKYKIKILKINSYQSNTINFTPYLNSIRVSLKKKKSEMNPDAIIFLGYAHQAGHAIKEAREMGIQIPILGSDGFDDPILFKLAGVHSLNTYALTHFSSNEDTLDIQEFVKEYTKKYSEAPGIWAPLFYDAIHLAAAAFMKPILTNKPQVLMERLLNGKVFFGVTGQIETQKGKVNRNTGVFVKAVQDKNQKFHFEYFKRLSL